MSWGVPEASLGIKKDTEVLRTCSMYPHTAKQFFSSALIFSAVVGYCAAVLKHSVPESGAYCSMRLAADPLFDTYYRCLALCSKFVRYREDHDALPLMMNQ